MKIAFLDRDGTLNKEYSYEEWKTMETPEIFPETLPALQLLKEEGYQFIVVTNQQMISMGDLSWERYERANAHLFAHLKKGGVEMLDVFCCPHQASDHCNCMKPRPGMIEQAYVKYPDIDFSQSIYFGDREADQLIAEHFGIAFYGVYEYENNTGKKGYSTILNAAEAVLSKGE